MLQVGDRVRVRRRKDLLCEFVEPYEELRIDVGHSFIESMYNYCGKETIIDGFENIYRGYKGYLLDIGCRYVFNSYMLENLDGKAL